MQNGVISDYIYDDLSRIELLRYYIDEDASGDYNTGDTLLAEFDYDLAANGQKP